MIIDKSRAILSLFPSAEFIIREGVVEWHVPNVAPVTDEQIEQELIRLKNEYEANEYQRQRQREYPSFADQFDLLYHGGYDAWKAEIDKIKNKYPKVNNAN